MNYIKKIIDDALADILEELLSLNNDDLEDILEELISLNKKNEKKKEQVDKIEKLKILKALEKTVDTKAFTCGFNGEEYFYAVSTKNPQSKKYSHLSYKIGELLKELEIANKEIKKT